MKPYYSTVLMVILVNWCVSGHSTVCHPCYCFPPDESPTLLVCQDYTITELPSLPSFTASTIKQILILGTLISCPQDPEQFTQLQQFEEANNEVFNCTCLQVWRYIHPNVDYVTDCDVIPSSQTDDIRSSTRTRIAPSATSELWPVTTTPLDEVTTNLKDVTSTPALEPENPTTSFPYYVTTSTWGHPTPGPSQQLPWIYACTGVLVVLVLLPGSYLAGRQIWTRVRRQRQPRRPKHFYEMNTIYLATTEADTASDA